LSRRSPNSTLFPYTTLFRSVVARQFDEQRPRRVGNVRARRDDRADTGSIVGRPAARTMRINGRSRPAGDEVRPEVAALIADKDSDRKSTRLNSSHVKISYAV